MLVPAEDSQDSGTARVVPTSVARAMAEEVGLDLVEVAPGSDPPVCRIMDYGKFRYIQLKKHKEGRRSGASNQTREVRMMPFIFENDLASKMKGIRGFLSDRTKVKVSILLKGRMQSRDQVAYELLQKIADELQDVAAVSREMLREGRTVSMILSPASNSSKRAAQPAAAPEAAAAEAEADAAPEPAEAAVEVEVAAAAEAAQGEES